MNEDGCSRPLPRLTLRVKAELLPQFSRLTGGGFTVLAPSGCSVRDLLCGQLGIPADYLDERIQTVFLNGKVLDDLRTATVPPGSTIALSAAMPGVAGAMLRKDSPYAAMRSRISQADPHVDPTSGPPAHVVIKLFNLVQAELGPALLSQGIQVPGTTLRNLFYSEPDAFRTGILSAQIDNTPIDPRALLQMDWPDQQVLLRVSC